MQAVEKFFIEKRVAEVLEAFRQGQTRVGTFLLGSNPRSIIRTIQGESCTAFVENYPELAKRLAVELREPGEFGHWLCGNQNFTARSC